MAKKKTQNQMTGGNTKFAPVDQSQIPDVPEEIQASMQEAAESGLYVAADHRPSIKLPENAPKIAVCIPMGAKDERTVYVNEKTGQRFVPNEIIDPNTDERVLAHVGARTNGLVPIEWLLNAWQIVPPLLCSMTILVRKGVLSSQGRNEMTWDAIKAGCKYIFYWDDDTIIPPKAIYDMHRTMEVHPEIGVLTGVYTTREELNEPLVYKRQGQGAYWEFDPTPDHVEEVFAAGAGCMMARVEALLDVHRIHGDDMFWADEQDMDAIDAGKGKIMWGHDIRFCKRMWETWQDSSRTGAEHPGPFGVADPAKKPAKNWTVNVAGWILCGHFDIQQQKIYSVPPEAPCFRNRNTATYWDSLWGAEGHDTWRKYPELYDAVLARVPAKSDVVDVGCGVGILMERLVKQRQCRAFGIDLSPKAIDMLQERYLEGVSGDILEADFRQSPFKQPVVVSTETIEHLDDKRLDHLLSQCAKHAKLAILTTPDGHLPGTPPGEHVQEWTAKELSLLLRKYFSYAKVESLGGRYLIAQATNNRKIGDQLCPPTGTSSGSAPAPRRTSARSRQAASSTKESPPAPPTSGGRARRSTASVRTASSKARSNTSGSA